MKNLAPTFSRIFFQFSQTPNKSQFTLYRDSTKAAGTSKLNAHTLHLFFMCTARTRLNKRTLVKIIMSATQLCLR